MSGRHEQRGGRSRLRWLMGGAALGLATSVLLAMTPAQAASATVNAQLSLSGVATASSPVGGTIVGVHPGDSVKFSAATVPTAGLDKLGLGSLVDNLGLTTYEVKVDFSGVPGGTKDTVLKGTEAKTFTFPTAGKYNFTWTAESASVLGLPPVPFSLNFPQLAAAGIKVNASGTYSGQIVVATDPPAGGISIQLPSVSAAPSLPVVGQLPTVSIPGVSVPTIAAPSIPNLLPKPPSLPVGGAKTTAPAGGVYTPPGLTVPDQIVPHGQGAAVYGSNGGGGFYNGALPGTGTQIGNLAPVSGTPSAKPSSVVTQDSTGKNKTIDLASADKSPSGQLPVILAILAIIALAM
ncbi:MAG TPA: hypothetical protein VGN18_00235, partial [Jatrophihabitans sp.]|nr:hypothetical protein [Jatrophihabitans sp.]